MVAFLKQDCRVTILITTASAGLKDYPPHIEKIFFFLTEREDAPGEGRGSRHIKKQPHRSCAERMQSNCIASSALP